MLGYDVQMLVAKVSASPIGVTYGMVSDILRRRQRAFCEIAVCWLDGHCYGYLSPCAENGLGHAFLFIHVAFGTIPQNLPLLTSLM